MRKREKGVRNHIKRIHYLNIGLLERDKGHISICRKERGGEAHTHLAFIQLGCSWLVRSRNGELAVLCAAGAREPSDGGFEGDAP